jgi:hypothetical protein
LVNTPLRAVSICLKTGMEAAYREIVMAVSEVMAGFEPAAIIDMPAACLLFFPA